MRIITNYKLIKRNRKIGQFTTIGSLVVLVIGLIISFTPDPEMFMWSFVALIGGFMLSQVGIFFGNRWGRSPRSDERLVQALKGLDDKYTLFNHLTVIPHLLVGPAGIWALVPFPQTGTITYDEEKGRWQQKGSNWYMKLFAQEGLGKPEQEVRVTLNDLQTFLDKQTSIEGLPTAQAAMIFTNPKAVVQANNPTIPTLHVDKLKDFIRRQSKESQADYGAIYQLLEILPLESIE